MNWCHVVFASVLAVASQARADMVSEVLGCEGDPCIVRNNPGGEIGAYRAAARELLRSGKRVVIDGPCLSACAMLADQARSRVCVTSRAKFGFHKGFVMAHPMAGGPMQLVKRFDPSHSRDVAGWVKKNGGYPARGFRVMGPRAAKRIWRSC